MEAHANAGPLRMGLVGCGWISEWHGNAAAAVADVELVACCDLHREVADQFAAKFGCDAVYDDYQTMVREHELDMVLLATWPADHLEQLHTCLDAGIRSILCEKSLALSPRDALEIWTAANDAGALIVEGFMWRHHPAVRKMHALIDADEIAGIDSISTSFDFYHEEEASADDQTRNWRQRKECGGGVAYDITCYCIDACNHFAGAPPKQAVAFTGTSAKYETIDRVYGLVEYENGVVGLIESSNKSAFNYELKISGVTGQLVLPVAWRIDGPTEFYLRRSTDLFAYDTQAFPFEFTDPYTVQMESFAAAVRGTGEPFPRLGESVVNALTTEALLRSSDEGAAVAIEIPSAVRGTLAESAA
jgi:predicted dehydrogenase